MLVTKETIDKLEDGEVFTKEIRQGLEDHCCVCKKAIEQPPFVFWHCYDEEHLSFHPSCALSVGYGIARDVEELAHGRKNTLGLYMSAKAYLYKFLADKGFL